MNISRGDTANPLDRDIVGVDRAAKGDPRQDGQLVGGIPSFKITGGISFGETELLSPDQRLLKTQIIKGHPGEDVVGGSIDNPDHACNPVGHKAVLQGTDQRNAAADAGFVVNVPPVAVSQLQQLPAMLRHEILVGGDNILAPLQRRADEGAGGLDPAHELHDNIDGGIFDHFIRMGRIDLWGQINRSGL